MKNENIWKGFMDSLTEDFLSKQLDDFIKYLGFDDFEKSDTTNFSETLTLEVYGFDDRRIFISSFYETNNTVKCRYVITDNKCMLFDNIVFKKDGNKWVEVEE